MGQSINVRADLSAVLIRKDGTRTDLGVISTNSPNSYFKRVRRFFKGLARVFGASLAILILSQMVRSGDLPWYTLPGLGLVTNAGVSYMATDFASGGVSPRISAFNFHDSGTGTTAAAVTDTALQTPTGNARVAGTQSTPGNTNVYQSVATLAYGATFAITEWGIFSASAAGTLWDHRVFSAINVLNGDSIQFTYKLTIPSGGS